MNLDDYKPLSKELTAPPNAPSGDANLGGLIAELRDRDRKERQRLLGTALALLPLGLALLAAAGEQRPGTRLTGAGILFVAAYLCLKGRWFGRVNYATPAREFLAAAAKRYRFWRAEDALFVVPLLLTLGAGGGITVWLTALKYWSFQGALLAVALYGVFLVALCIFAWIVSRKKWRAESGALLEAIRRHQQHLENG